MLINFIKTNMDKSIIKKPTKEKVLQALTDIVVRSMTNTKNFEKQLNIKLDSPIKNTDIFVAVKNAVQRYAIDSTFKK